MKAERLYRQNTQSVQQQHFKVTGIFLILIKNLLLSSGFNEIKRELEKYGERDGYWKLRRSVLDGSQIDKKVETKCVEVKKKVEVANKQQSWEERHSRWDCCCGQIYFIC